MRTKSNHMVFTPKNTIQRIFSLLEKAPKPLTKEEIAEIIDSTSLTVAQNLPTLTGNGWVGQSRGYYFITKEGRARYEEDPYVSLPSKREKRTDYFMKMDWDFIKRNEICREVIEQQGSYEGVAILQQELTPIVLVWLASMGQKLPSFSGGTDPDDKDNKRVDLLKTIFDRITSWDKGM